MKRLFKFQYPKTAILIISIFLAYIIFSNSNVGSFISNLGDLSYLGDFIAGMLFAFGFTAPFSVGYFITASHSSILLAGLLGGLGALLSDILIFKLIRFSFMDEFKRLEHTKIIKEISKIIEKSLGKRIKIYLLYAFAGILIASPLPDEAGVIMLAGLTKIKLNILAIISFILNTAGILIILILSR
jgi:uncharacterized membrane protein YdjX (TVP38/TMEM64 family)